MSKTPQKNKEENWWAFEARIMKMIETEIFFKVHAVQNPLVCVYLWTRSWLHEWDSSFIIRKKLIFFSQQNYYFFETVRMKKNGNNFSWHHYYYFFSLSRFEERIEKLSRTFKIFQYNEIKNEEFFFMLMWQHSWLKAKKGLEAKVLNSRAIDLII